MWQHLIGTNIKNIEWQQSDGLINNLDPLAQPEITDRERYFLHAKQSDCKTAAY